MSPTGSVLTRILFLLSGLVACAAAAPYILLRGIGLPYQREWIVFAIVAPVVGAISMLAAILPAPRIEKLCPVEAVFSLPLRMFSAFAAVAYILTIALYSTPHQWHLDSFLWTFLICPVYLVRTNFDPQPLLLFAVLAPIDAVAYGAIGTALGFSWLAGKRLQRKSLIV